MPTKKAVTKKPVKKVVTKKAPTKKPSVKKAATKKVAAKKKPAAKKTPAKRTITKKAPTKKTKIAAAKQSAKDLQYASDEQSFWVTNGEILNSLMALHNALDTMPNDVFAFHATGDQNDFSVWVETVLCDADCAADLKKAKSQKGAKTTVAKHLKHYAA